MSGVNVDPPHIRAQLATPRITEREIEGGHPAECVYCGSRESLAGIWKRNPRAISCCPERAMRFPREPNDHDMEWIIHA